MWLFTFSLVRFSTVHTLQLIMAQLMAFYGRGRGRGRGTSVGRQGGFHGGRSIVGRGRQTSYHQRPSETVVGK